MRVGAVSSSTAIASATAPVPTPPTGLPTDRAPTPEEVAANHQAFQQNLVQTYRSVYQASSPAIPNGPNGSGNATGGSGNALPPTSVLGDDPNDAFRAGLVDSYLNASTSSATPNPFGVPSLTYQPPIPVNPQDPSASALVPTGVGINVSATS